MGILELTVTLSGVLAAVGCWFLHHLLIQNGRILLRLEALERRVFDWPRPLHDIKCGNQFEADNIVHPILFTDEYGIGDVRFEPSDVIIDVGAHIGAFAYLCHLRGSRAIHCYEPGERNFELLQHNLGFRAGVHVSHTAIWRSDGAESPELLLSGADGENTGASSVLASGRTIDFSNQAFLNTSTEAHRTTTVPLDQVLERFDRVKLLKIDCEGSEFPILLTSRQL
jgi:FkbM family methyltransferase